MAQAQTHGAPRRSASIKAKGGRRVAAEGRSFGPGNRATGPTIGREIAKLAKNPKITYDQIAERVRETVPGSRTSAKSVASVVHDLRAAGVDVPERERRSAQH